MKTRKLGNTGVNISAILLAEVGLRYPEPMMEALS
jgi:hypothetical protein